MVNPDNNDTEHMITYVRDHLVGHIRPIYMQQCALTLLCALQVPILGNFTRREPNSVVVMDNATIHHDARITTLIENAGAICLYMSPYSPDYNPIELVFGWIKLHMKRHFHSRPVGRDHVGALMAAFSLVGEGTMRAFFRHCGLAAEEEEAQGDAAALLLALVSSGLL
jgi:hypothetical protein